MYEPSTTTAFLKGSKWLTIAVRVARDRRSGMRMRRGEVVEKTMGSTHRDFGLDQSLAYIDSVFEDYLRYGEIGAGDLHGARVMELGPGDNLGVAMRFLAAGAERVEGVDRFATWRDEDQQAAIQGALAERLGKPVTMTRIETTEGLPIEEAAESFEPESFDLIVSRAVLEHVYDPDATFAAIDSLLKPGGKSIHKIDFEDHGLFTAGGLHPLTFLTVPDRLYRWMGENSGLPNRHLADYFRRKMDAMGYRWRALLHPPDRGRFRARTAPARARPGADRGAARKDRRDPAPAAPALSGTRRRRPGGLRDLPMRNEAEEWLRGSSDSPPSAWRRGCSPS